MAAPPRYRIRQTPTDVWSTRERLCLASSVLRSGDQNWVSVSRAIKPFGEPNRPPDWFSQKNCALQYSDLLEKVEAPKRKRWERADKETPGDLIVRKLTIERIEELKKRVLETQVKYRKKKREVEIIKHGKYDDKLDEIWNQIKEEVKAKEVLEKEHQKWLEQRETRIAALKAMPKIGSLLTKKKVPGKISRVGELRRRNSSQSELSEPDSAAESPINESLNIEVDDAVSSPMPISFTQDVATPVTPTKASGMPISTSSPTSSQQPAPSTSPLLTSLLNSPTPTTPVSPVASGLVSPSTQPKEGTLATPQASPRSSSTPQPFFNPSSALATAAARQLAVATASSTPSISLFSSDKQDSSNQGTSSSTTPVITAHSVTSSAPTLSKLLEMPPSTPGKLPPLPIVHPAASSTVSVPTIKKENSEINIVVPAVISESITESSVTEISTATDADNSAAIDSVPEADTIELQVKMEVDKDVPHSTPSADSSDLVVESESDSKVVLASAVNPTESASQDEDKTETISEPSVEVIKLDPSVLSSKEDSESQELEQVLVMEVDFATENEKGEIIEVFELTAPEGSIVELQYETICDEEVSLKEDVTEVPIEVKSFSEEVEPTPEPIDVSTTGAKIEDSLPSLEEKSAENISPSENLETLKEAEAVIEISVPVEIKTEKVTSDDNSLEEEISLVELKTPEKVVVLEEKQSYELLPDEVTVNITSSDESKVTKNDTVVEIKIEVDEEKDLPAKPEEKQLEQAEDPCVKASADEQPEVKIDINSETQQSPEDTAKLASIIVKSDEVTVKSTKRLSRKGRKSRDPSNTSKKGRDPSNTAKKGRDPSNPAKKGRGRPPSRPPVVEIKVESTPPPTNNYNKTKDALEIVEEKHIKAVCSVDLPTSTDDKPKEDTNANSTATKNMEESSADDSADQSIVRIEDDSLVSESDVTLQDSMSQEMVASPQVSFSEEPSVTEDKYQPSSSITDSIPNSPASTAPSDDQETLLEYKVWKKAIMLVWRAAANHKFANVFLHPVTNDVAPGYHSIVYRPMDLSVIKKNIENGVIRSTIEFQRDMMLMFQNAIMYNSSDHDVYVMALEMQKEVMEQIQDFLATQLMLQTAESKVLRGRERVTRERKTEFTDKEEDLKRKRSSTSISDGESKSKKRKT